MKALIIDSEELLRLSLKQVLAIAGRFKDILEAGSETDFMSTMSDNADISLVILHPESMKNQGENWVKLVRRLYPGVPIITITNTEGATPPSHLLGTTTLPRNTSVADMISTIRRLLNLPIEMIPKRDFLNQPVQNTETEFKRFQQSINVKDPARVDLGRLSFRQKEILAMAADGLANKEIAARLKIAEGTVKAHMHAIFKVLGVTNRTQAVIKYGASGEKIDADPKRTADPTYLREQDIALPSSLWTAENKKLAIHS